MTRVLFDYDPLLYACASIGEKRYIKVVHRESGDEYEFSNRTDFWGNHHAKAGGWLAEYNRTRTTPRMPSEFDIVDVQEPEPIRNCLRTLKQMILRVKEHVGANSYYGYSGKGKSFREEVSTVLMYKGNRINAIRPIHLDETKEYLVKFHSCKIVTGIEADDAVSMDSWDAYNKWSKTKSDNDLLITAAVDKDYDQGAAHLLHPEDLGEIRSHNGGFGWLKTNEKGKVVGRGRKWLYFQIISGDSADNYRAHAGSKKRWGEKTAFPYLEHAKNDKEAWEGLVRAYKFLYPKPAEIVGWRGYEDPDKMTRLKSDHEQHIITVDWLSMLQENTTLAFMLRWPDDKIDVKETLNKLGVEYAG